MIPNFSRKRNDNDISDPYYPPDAPESPVLVELIDRPARKAGVRQWLLLLSLMASIVFAFGIALFFSVNSVHILLGQDPAPAAGAQTGATVRDMGTLPADLCLAAGQPVLLVPTGGNNIYMAGLAYVNEDGDLILWEYDNQILGIPSRHVFKWSAKLCPNSR